MQELLFDPALYREESRLEKEKWGVHSSKGDSTSRGPAQRVCTAAVTRDSRFESAN